MSMDTQFRNWTITGNFGLSAAVGVGAGGFQYGLVASDPVVGTTPTRQPFTTYAPTRTRRSIRQRVPGSPSVETVPRPRVISGYTHPRLRTRFPLSFMGVGAGPGIDLAGSISTPSDASSTTSLHFLGPSRSARDLLGEGIIIDGGISDQTLVTASIQILLIGCPVSCVGGLTEFGQMLDDLWEEETVSDPVTFFQTILQPDVVIAVVVGIGTGISIGLTLYGGIFSVR